MHHYTGGSEGTFEKHDTAYTCPLDFFFEQNYFIKSSPIFGAPITSVSSEYAIIHHGLLQ
jgi:hypothetical protein